MILNPKNTSYWPHRFPPRYRPVNGLERFKARWLPQWLTRLWPVQVRRVPTVTESLVDYFNQAVDAAPDEIKPLMEAMPDNVVPFRKKKV